MKLSNISKYAIRTHAIAFSAVGGSLALGVAQNMISDPNNQHIVKNLAAMAGAGYILIDNILSAVKATRPFDLTLSITEKLLGLKSGQIVPHYTSMLQEREREIEKKNKKPESYFKLLTPEVVEIGDIYLASGHLMTGVAPMRVIMKSDSGFTAKYSWWHHTSHQYGSSNGVIVKKDTRDNMQMYAEQHLIDSLKDIDTQEPPRRGLESKVD